MGQKKSSSQPRTSANMVRLVGHIPVSHGKRNIQRGKIKHPVATSECPSWIHAPLGPHRCLNMLIITYSKHSRFVYFAKIKIKKNTFLKMFEIISQAKNIFVFNNNLTLNIFVCEKNIFRLLIQTILFRK